jgi:hypothetical protein
MDQDHEVHSHPIPIGAMVTVLRRTATRAVIEGRAVVKANAPARHRYRVQFIGDPILKERGIYRDDPSNTDRTIEAMLDSHCDERALSPIVSDFFPEDMST